MLSDILKIFFHSTNSSICRFGSPISAEMGGLNDFLRGLAADSANDFTEEQLRVNSYQDIINTFFTPYRGMDEDQLDTLRPGLATVVRRVRDHINIDAVDGTNYGNSENPDDRFFAVRTCNAYWNPQVPIRETDVDPMYLGMASQAGEREDTIITPDLRGKVCVSRYRETRRNHVHLLKDTPEILHLCTKDSVFYVPNMLLAGHLSIQDTPQTVHNKRGSGLLFSLLIFVRCYLFV